MRRIVTIAAILLATAGASDAFAWGCDGHQAIAMIAERLLGSATLNELRAVLAASPADPNLRRYCAPLPSDVLADVATWADDYRAVDATTAGWHFVNVPRPLGSIPANDTRYCRSGNCVIDAIVAQFRVLKTSADRALKANALRFIVHFVGDIHQPLHAITNGDRGGNCVPVFYFDHPPEDDGEGNFSPNLHAVWDTHLVRSLMATNRLADARALSDYVAAQRGLPQGVTARPATRADVKSWAREAYAQGRSVGYGRLPVRVPLEPASAITLTSCKDNRDVVHRMLALNERVDQAYEHAAAPVIVRQLGMAGVRLAAVLKSAFAGD